MVDSRNNPIDGVYHFPGGKEALINDPAMLNGVVLNGAHGIYDVHSDEGVYRCTLRGKLKKAFARAQSAQTTNQNRTRYNKVSVPSRRVERIEKRDSSENPLPVRLSVGDFVKFRRLDETNGLIEEILPRQNALVRKDAASNEKKTVQQTLLANLDQVVMVFAVTQPDPHFAMLDRYLAICESANLAALVCLNKADLAHETYVESAAALYQKLGYPVLWTSAFDNQGIDELKAQLKDHTTLFTGPSGVGKSSLVNAIEPDMAIRTGLVSDATGKGRHTTTSSQLYPLSDGGWLADSAGIRALAALNIAPDELASCFIEFRPYLGECEFVDCSHIDEEGCAIIQSVNDEVIDERRYRSYIRMYNNEER